MLDEAIQDEAANAGRGSRMRPRGRQCWRRPSRMRLPMLDEAVQNEAARSPMLDEVQTMIPNFLRFQCSVRLIQVGLG